jgi:nucleotide-binding universal stress UspA family protein
MVPNIVVLTDFSLAAERARAYAAALAEPLKAELHLVHVFLPTPIVTEYGAVLPDPTPRTAETENCLKYVAAAMPVPATAEVLEAEWPAAVEQALARYRPMLVVAGLTATSGRLDEWLSNRSLPLAQQTGYPLLLVPEHLPDTELQPPRRLVLALEDRPFELARRARAVAPMLDALACDIVPVTVLAPEQRAAGWNGLHAAQHCGLAACMPRCELHPIIGELPAAGVLQAIDDLGADVVALLDQGHGWAHKLFSGSVIDYVLRRTQVPVLLLSAQVAP